MTDLTTPQMLAQNYEFKKLLGEGANGKTWLAYDRLRNVHVAIKELKFNTTEEFKSLELFKREAEVLKSIEVRGVPKFYESIISNSVDSPCYIVQEFVDYPSIQEILDDHYKFSEQETLDLLVEVTKILFALQTRYSPPIIHRDIKPSNILCMKDDVGIHVYLIDFGAVANPQKKSGGSTIAGTFGYMAPEQMQGEVSIQSDFYALGATALHMLTGVSPYNIESEVFKLNFRPVISQEAPRTSNEMRQLLSLLLSPERENRPKDAQTLLKYLENVKRHRAPNYEATFQPATESADKINWLAKRYMASAESETTPTEQWKMADGLIRRMATLTDPDTGMLHNMFEYTFTAFNRTWCGFGITQDAANKQYNFPIKCKIRYNPMNPRINKIM